MSISLKLASIIISKIELKLICDPVKVDIDYGISFYLNSNFTTKTKYFSSQTWHIDFEDDVIDELVRYITAGEIEYVVTPEYATTREANKKTIDQLLVKVPSLSLIDSNLEGNKYIDIYKLN